MDTKTMKIFQIALHLGEQPVMICTNEWGEPIASHIWTGWVCEITSWSSKLYEKKNSDHFRGIYKIYLKLVWITPQPWHEI